MEQGVGRRYVRWKHFHNMSSFFSLALTIGNHACGDVGSSFFLNVLAKAVYSMGGFQQLLNMRL